MEVPQNFIEYVSPEIKRVAANCPYVLQPEHPQCSFKPGSVVWREDTKLLLLGYTPQDGFACAMDRHGDWWVVDYEDLSVR